MKKTNLIIAGFILLAAFTACNGDSGTTSTTTTDNTTIKTSDSGNAMNNSTMDTNANSTTTPASTSRMPLSKTDSTFVMKAAAGGMMEVDAGNIAQTNAMNDRVKAFGTMMVNDHSKANSELMSLAASRGITLPTELPADMKKHDEELAKLKGKAFDSHYMNMMLTDHKKDIAEFEKAAKSSDADIQAFATRTLPTLKVHLDSAQAISKGKM